jgi:hypothetical protein
MDPEDNRPAYIFIDYFGWQVNDELDGFGYRKVVDCIEEILFGIRVEFLLMKGGGVEGIEELHDVFEDQFDDKFSILMFINGFRVIHGKCSPPCMGTAACKSSKSLSSHKFSTSNY